MAFITGRKENIMPKIAYIEKTFRGKTLNLINLANQIIQEYQSQGYDLTLRQLYYQLVARDIIPNNQKEYKRLGAILNDARLAGLVDWKSLVDRTRNLRGNQHWESPAQIVQAAVNSYRRDRWQGQGFRLEVWVEKDALIGVIGRVCGRLDIPFFSCRGYTSASEMWTAGQRLRSYAQNGQDPIVLHLGDHDPSGIDMTRDIEERLELFADTAVTIERIALNRDQIDQYKPPPNPAKLTDSRADGYIAKHGRSSWELDALDPNTLTQLITEWANRYIDQSAWEQVELLEAEHREMLTEAAKSLTL